MLEQARTREQLAQQELERAKRLVEHPGDLARRVRRAHERRSPKAAARFARAEAALRNAKLNLDWTTVRAPISGRVGRAEITAGNLVQGGSPAPSLLTTIVSLDPIYVYFDSDEQAYLKYIGANRAAARSERSVQIGLAERDGLPARGEARLRRQPASTAPRGRFASARVLPNPNGAFAPGLFARVRLASGAAACRRRWCRIRRSAPTRIASSCSCSSRTARSSIAPITVGRVVDGLRVVQSGLKPGESVVVNGLLRVRPGMKVVGEEHAMVAMSTLAHPSAASRAPGETAESIARSMTPSDIRALHPVRFSRFFIDRPVFAVVLSLVILAAGSAVDPRLPISEYPEVAPPTIAVRAVYPGANPTVLAQTVGTPLEDAINGVEHMLYMSSSATADGVLNLTVTFEIGTDVDLAQVQVQNRVSQALARLPEEVRALGVVTEKRSPDITMVVHLVSPDGRYDPVYLRNYAAAQRQGTSWRECRARDR